MANKRGMSRHAASFVKSPDGSARLFDRRGDRWNTVKDAVQEFGIETCPCCGQTVNPEIDQYTKASRAPLRKELGPDTPIRPKGLGGDPTAIKTNIHRKLMETLRKKGVVK